MNMDANGLSKNLCSNQMDFARGRWHVGEDEKEMPRWYVLLCLSF